MYLRSCLNRLRVVHPNDCMPIVIAQEMLDAQAMLDSAHSITPDGGSTASFTSSRTSAETHIDFGEIVEMHC